MARSLQRACGHPGHSVTEEDEKWLEDWPAGHGGNTQTTDSQKPRTGKRKEPPRENGKTGWEGDLSLWSWQSGPHLSYQDGILLPSKRTMDAEAGDEHSSPCSTGSHWCNLEKSVNPSLSHFLKPETFSEHFPTLFLLAVTSPVLYPVEGKSPTSDSGKLRQIWESSLLWLGVWSLDVGTTNSASCYCASSCPLLCRGISGVKLLHTACMLPLSCVMPLCSMPPGWWTALPTSTDIALMTTPLTPERISWFPWAL